MYLFLDPSREGSVTLQLMKGGMSSCVPLHHSEELLEIIDAFLQAEKVTPRQLKGIMVVNDAPRFTTIRNVITVLNTMAWQLNIPIKETSAQKESLVFKPLTPHYSAPPTITPPAGALSASKWRAGLPNKKEE